MKTKDETVKQMPEWLAERHRQTQPTSEECVETEIGLVRLIDADEYNKNLAELETKKVKRTKRRGVKRKS